MSAGVGSATFRERSMQKGVPLAFRSKYRDAGRAHNLQGSFWTNPNRDSAKVNYQRFVWEPGFKIMSHHNYMTSSLPHFSS